LLYSCLRQFLETQTLRILFLLFGLCPVLLSSIAAESQTLPLMPLPASIQQGPGQLVVDSSFLVGIGENTDARLRRATELFLEQLRRQTGMPVSAFAITNGAGCKLQVKTQHPARAVQELGEDESYSLEVTAASAKLDAVTTLGVMRGLQTFLQLVQTTSAGFAVPAVQIRDQPRFPWRGLMIDVGRHFIPLDILKRNIDAMAAVKLNVFHWHLSENQGFRVESKQFPKLHEMGSDGLYYTQDEIRDLIAYAGDRGIRVVPEFDMPGHSTAWLVGYPELGSGPGPYQIERKWGVFDPAMDPTEESTYKFLDKFIGEMARLFPDKYFHIGGDEVNGKQWDANPKIQAFMRTHSFKNNQDLQAYFNTRVQKIVSKHGKIMIGWDEILRPDLPKNIVVQSWRGQASLAQAATLGYRGLLSFGYYLDLMWPASQHYAVDPLEDGAANLNVKEKERILGGEACMWSEYVSPENIDSRIWPRMAPIAERLWSPQNVKDADSMYQRMETISHWLEWRGLTHDTAYGPMLRRIAGSDDISVLKILADVVEPVKDYMREETARTEATSLIALNRLVDAARSESMTARQFSMLTNAYLGGSADAATKEQLRTWLVRWRDNDANLKPLEQSFLVQEDVPLSEYLSSVAASGLQALDYLERGERPTADWASSQMTMLKQAAQPQAQLLLMVVGPVHKLVDAASKGPQH
jgi:hexosaminidase